YDLIDFSGPPAHGWPASARRVTVSIAIHLRCVIGKGCRQCRWIEVVRISGLKITALIAPPFGISSVIWRPARLLNKNIVVQNGVVEHFGVCGPRGRTHSRR